MHGYFKYDRSRLDICLLKDWVEWELTMVVGRAFHWTNGATRFYRHGHVFHNRTFFWGLRGVEFGIQILWHIRENCRFCILGQIPFPTILQNSGLHTENFVLFTYILKNKAQTQIFDFSNLYKPLSISSANWMLLLCLAARIISGIYPLLLDQDSLEGSHRLIQNPNQSTSTQDSLEGSHRLLQNPNQSTSTQDSLEGSHRLLQNPNQSTSTQIYLEHHGIIGIILLGTGVTVPISLTFYRKFAL